MHKTKEIAPALRKHGATEELGKAVSRFNYRERRMGLVLRQVSEHLLWANEARTGISR